MKKVACVISMVMVLGLVTAVVGVADNKADIASNVPLAAADKALSGAVKNVELTGTVLSNNTFVDENGQNYELGVSEAGAALQNLVGEKVKVQATVIEKSKGLKSIAVTSYEVIK